MFKSCTPAFGIKYILLTKCQHVVRHVCMQLLTQCTLLCISSSCACLVHRGKWLHSEWTVTREGIGAGITLVPFCNNYGVVDLYVTVSLYMHGMCNLGYVLIKLVVTPNLSLWPEQRDALRHNDVYLSCTHLIHTQYTYMQFHIHTQTHRYL